MSLISSNLKPDLVRYIPDQPELSYLTLKHKHMDVWVTWAGTLENKVSKFFSLISLISSFSRSGKKLYTCLMCLSSSNSKPDLMWYMPDQPDLSILKTNMDVFMTERPEHDLLENQISKFFSILINLISTISKPEMKGCIHLIRLNRSYVHVQTWTYVWYDWVVQLQSKTWSHDHPWEAWAIQHGTLTWPHEVLIILISSFYHSDRLTHSSDQFEQLSYKLRYWPNH